MIILRNCNLIPELTEDYDGAVADVVSEGNRIQAICPAGTAVCEGAEEYDLTGKTLLPGFMDLHTHLYFTHEYLPGLVERTEGETVIASIDAAKDKLRYGYTTIRDAGAAYNAAILVRDAVGAGIVPGPRILAGGRCVTPTTKGNDAFGPLYHEFDDPAQARQVVRKELADGADFIKYMSTGAGLNPGGKPGVLITTRDELTALVEAAEENDTYVASHCHGKEGIMLCVECGVKTIEHATYIDQECVDAIKAHGNRSAIVPTFAIIYAIDQGIVPDMSEDVLQKIRECMEYSMKAIKSAVDQGVKCGWGTDVDKAAFDIDPFLEFKARRDMGFTNLEMLKQATIENAEILEMEDQLGTVKEGKLADLIVLAGDPVNDFNALAAKPEMVFRDGQLYQL